MRQLRILHARAAWLLASGGSLLVLGLAVLAGWVSRQPALVRLLPDSYGMPGATAAGFVLSGLALLLLVRPSAAGTRNRSWTAVPAVLLVLLGLGALFEWYAGVRLGLAADTNALRQWFLDPNPYAGRMRPSAALGFIATGLTVLLMHRPVTVSTAIAAEGLALLVFMIGFVGAVGHAAGFGDVVTWMLGPVLTASIGFMIAAAGLWLAARRYAGSAIDAGTRIGLSAGATVIVTGLAGLFGGFAVLYPHAADELRDKLTLSLRSRIDILESAVNQAWLDGRRFANQQLQLNAMSRLDRNPLDAEAQRQIASVAGQYATVGLSAVVFHDNVGREVARAGHFVADPELRVPVTTSSPSELLWHHGYVLRMRIDMIDDGRKIGVMEAEHPLNLGAQLHDPARFGSSLDFGVCAPVGDKVDCFPFRSSQWQVLHRAALDYEGQPVPMSYALAGKTGIVQTTDYRGVMVIAAHAPLEMLGLGAVLKIDATEFYQPVTRRIVPLLALLLLLGAGAVLALRLHVVPLARTMQREIEERQRAEHRLAESEGRLVEITTTLGEGVCVVDEHGVIAFANPEAEKLLGFGAGELVGCNGHDTFRPQDADGAPLDREACPLCRAVAEGRPFRNIDDRLTRKDGTPLSASIIARPILRDGRNTGTVISFEDIAERKRLEEAQARLTEAVRQRERRMRALLDASPESTFLLDPQGGVLATNQVACQRLGTTPKQLVGKSFYDLMPPELGASRRADLDQVVATAMPLRTGDRRGAIEFENNIVPVVDDAGAVEAVAVYARDVTEQHRAQRTDAMFHRLDLMQLKWRMGLVAIAQTFCDEVLPLFDLRAARIARADADGSLTIVARAPSGGAMPPPDQGAEAAMRSGQMQKLTTADAAAGLILPLTIGGATWGVLALYADAPDAFDPPELTPRLATIANRLCVSLEACLQQERLTLLDAALSAAGNGIFITDADGRIVEANASLSRLTGYPVADVLGKTPHLFSSGAHGADFYREFWHTIESGSTWQGEIVNVRPDGTRYTVSQTVTPLRDADERIGHYVSIVEDISEKKAIEARIAHMANFDALTDLPNRTMMFDRLTVALALARRDGGKVAVLFLDLDRFKEVNDTLGHDFGDLLLCSAAHRLRAQVRETDTVARFAGDEFVIVLPHVADAGDALRVADKIVAAIARPFELKEHEVTIGVSIGVALYPSHGSGIEQILSAADKAMYEAKQRGRSTCCIAQAA